MYIYTETGILIGRILYKEITKKYGKPCSVSEDGLSLLFRHSEKDEQLHLIKVSLTGLEWVKTINVRVGMTEAVKSLSDDHP
jgi:hypothetical protein